MIASMNSTTNASCRSPTHLTGLAALILLACAPAAAAGSKDTARPAELRKVLQKVEKRIEKAGEAMEDGNSSRGSTLLRLADEDLSLFLDGSGLERLLETMARARQAAGEPDLQGAHQALLAIRAGMNTLADYIVRRDAEVAYQAARRAAEVADRDAYVEALHQLDSAILAPLLMARITTARDAIAGGRAAMVRRNMEMGRGEVETARAALDGLRLAAALSQAVFGLQIASEFIADGHAMAAREQLRDGGRALRQALEVAPDDLLADLRRVEEEVMVILDRLSKPQPEDPGTLEEALKRVQALRTGQQ